jgi:hypothetical protein
MSEENITLLLKSPPLLTKGKGKQSYKSKYPPNLPPSYSTFNLKTTSHPHVNNVNGDYKLHNGNYDHMGRFAYWGRPKGLRVKREEDNPKSLASAKL